MDEFKVGEVVLHINDPTITEPDLRYLNGLECKIVAPLAMYKVWQQGRHIFELGYECLFPNGEYILCAPHELRKRRPPTMPSEVARQVMLDCIQRAKRPVGVGA